jgi:hypothetical protein
MDAPPGGYHWQLQNDCEFPVFRLVPYIKLAIFDGAKKFANGIVPGGSPTGIIHGY